MLIYDPSNNPVFPNFLQDSSNSDSGFAFRTISSIKSLHRSLYVPYGPNLEKYASVDKFFEYWESKHLLRIRIDLPIILDKNIENYVRAKFLTNGFQEFPNYVIDSETIVITPAIYRIASDDKYRLNKAKKMFQFSEVECSPDILDSIYSLYLDSAKRQGYVPKNKEVIEFFINKNKVVIATDENNTIHSYIVYDIQHSDANGLMSYSMYTGTTEYGLKNSVGYGIYDYWINLCFERGIENVNLYGIKPGTGYDIFKRKFVYKSEDIAIKKLAGSFGKIIL